MQRQVALSLPQPRSPEAMTRPLERIWQNSLPAQSLAFAHDSHVLGGTTVGGGDGRGVG